MSEQLSFDLPARAALGRDDFFVAPANAVAVALIDTWPDWPGRKLMLIGPTGAGKTHLTHVWAAVSGAAMIEARDLAGTDIAAFASGPVAVENIADIAELPEAQEALFHLHNLTLAEGHSLLLTGRGEPAHWPLSLPDLKSRLQGTTVARLDAPDDALISAILMKLFADRQLSPAPDVIPYLVRRIDRSFQSAAEIVRRLDRAALAEGRALTRKFVGQALDKSPE